MDSYEIWVEKTNADGKKQRSSYNGDAQMAIAWLRANIAEIEHAVSLAEAKNGEPEPVPAAQCYPGCVLTHPHEGPAVLGTLRQAGWLR